MKTLYLYDVPGSYVLVRGVGLRDWLREHHVPAVWSAKSRGFMLRRDRVPDVLAMAQESSVPVRRKAA